MLLAHISDLHIRSSGCKLYNFIDTNALCARHVAYLNGLQEPPDAVIVTGDIVNCGLDEEYTMALDILTRITFPLYIIPGNHDNKRCFLNAFGKIFTYLGNDPDSIHYVVDIGYIRMLFLDSSVTGELYGLISDNTLEWLTKTLAEKPDRQTLLFMHHHPLPSGCAHMDNICCRNGDALLDLLSRFPQITHLFCGHTHRVIMQQRKGLFICTAPSAAHQVPFNTFDLQGSYTLEPPGMLMHRYTEELGLTTHVASLAPFDGPFPFIGNDCPQERRRD